MNMQTVTETVKAAPPVTVGMASFYGMHLSEIVQVLAIIWTLFLIIEKFPVVIERIRSLINWLGSLHHD